MRTNPWYWNGKDPEDDAYISFNFVSEGLIDAAGIKLLDGTDIDPAKKIIREGQESLSMRLWQKEWEGKAV